jgi:DNA mismatch repair protein MutL
MLAADDLIETQTEEKGIRIRALLGHPSASRTNNQFQYAFLNGRFIRDKFISHAIKEAYRGLLEPNRFPVAFLFIEMPYDEYDVNVHPTKTEVRFYNSNLVHSQILSTKPRSCSAPTCTTPAKLPSGHRARRRTAAGAAGQRQEIADAMADFFKQHRPVNRQQQFDLQPDEQPAPAGAPSRREPAIPHEAAPPELSFEGPKYLQIHDSYIVEQTEEGFVIIDQHALHEAMLYETLRQRAGSGPLESQRLLLPETLDVTDAQADAIENNADMIARLGIELAPFGPRTYAIQAFPTLLAKVSPVGFVQDLVDLLVSRKAAPNPEDMLDEVLNMTACKAAIKAGQKLTDSEIGQLLADRQRYESISRCPHGRPTTITFSIGELEKQFKRT